MWLRGSAGFSPQDRSEPFANFFFGGFGNNYVDHQDPKRYREYQSFPGAEINEIGGRNYVKGTAEWNLPPVRFSRLGSPGFYASWIRPAIFVSGLATNLDHSDARHAATSIGSQLDLRLTVISSVDVTVSFGAATVLEQGHDARDALMASVDAAALSRLNMPALVALRTGRSLPGSPGPARQLQAGQGHCCRHRNRQRRSCGLLSIPVTTAVDAALHLPTAALVRYAGPIIEESLKLVLIAVILRRRQIGFPVDAAVLGFAVGAGFAVVENIVYLRAITDTSIVLWLVRGLGTAILHGGTSSIAAMTAKMMVDSTPNRLLRPLAGGWGAAVLLHSAYNHLLLPPLASTLLLLVVFPVLILTVFQRSEAATREWVGAGLDLDIELLQLIASEHFGLTRFGTYLEELRERFPGPVVVDMFCMLKLELELSVQAKALLLAREAGLKMAPHPDVAAGLAELRHLRSSIGPTGMLALTPLHVTSHRDDWHRYLVAETGTGRFLRRKPASR